RKNNPSVLAERNKSDVKCSIVTGRQQQAIERVEALRIVGIAPGLDVGRSQQRCQTKSRNCALPLPIFDEIFTKNSLTHPAINECPLCGLIQVTCANSIFDLSVDSRITHFLLLGVYDAE